MTTVFNEKMSTLTTLYGEPGQLLARTLRQFIRRSLQAVQRLNGGRRPDVRLYLIARGLDQLQRDEILHRLRFYQPEGIQIRIVECESVPRNAFLRPDPILIAGPRSPQLQRLIEYRPMTYDVDLNTNPLDGWDWANLANDLDPERPDLKASKERLGTRIGILRAEKKRRSYVLGTGPSLAGALQRRWDDGYRIVCNTIVRDQELWDYLRPDFIVAGDAIYHFGFTSFARAFRADLRERLMASDTLFIYPAQFHSIVRRELKGLEGQLVPIPTGWRRRIDVDLARTFRLPNLGNVLGLLLLPLATTLASQIYLWGFDGRAPGDALFWSNSARHSYPEHLPELQKAHPRFFEHYVPAADPTRYVRSVQGDQLDLCLQLAEARGRQFVMMHPSWTPTLQKRYRASESNGYL